MNIFVLDESPRISAEMMCDKHVVKMIIESAQMLSTSHRYVDGDEFISYSKNGRRIKRWSHYTDTPDSKVRLHKSVMLNHPCTIWTRETAANYAWLAAHALALCDEYECRYNRTHATRGLIEWLVTNYPEKVYGLHRTAFAQAMPDEYKVTGDAVAAYRAYYLGEKRRFAKWKNGNVPNWYAEGLTKDVDVVQYA
jgi:hypothetical protein